MPDQPLLGPAFRPHSHEAQRHGLGDGLRLAALHGAVEVHLRVAEIAAAGGEHLADEPVVRHVLLDARADPAVIGLHRVGPELDGELRLDPQQVAPLHRPVVGELVALQEAIDQLAAFVGVGILEELPRLVGRGQRADHVQVGPAEENPVGADPGRRDAQLFQPAEDQLVDPALGSRLGVAFKGARRWSGLGPVRPRPPPGQRQQPGIASWYCSRRNARRYFPTIQAPDGWYVLVTG